MDDITLLCLGRAVPTTLLCGKASMEASPNIVVCPIEE